MFKYVGLQDRALKLYPALYTEKLIFKILFLPIQHIYQPSSVKKDMQSVNRQKKSNTRTEHVTIFFRTQHEKEQYYDIKAP